MDLRCQHCGHRIVVATPPATHRIMCPDCGEITEFPPPVSGGTPAHYSPRKADPTRASQRRLRRIFNPIPRSFVYLVGAALVLVALAPFWVYLLKDRLENHRPVLSDDAISLPVPAATETTRPSSVVEEPPAAMTNVIDEFLGIRLDATLEQLQQHFPLRLQNTRGMVPEIYQATGVGKIETVTMHFYNNLLKELWVEMAERRIVPDRIEHELSQRFGEPKARTLQSAGQGDERLGLGLTMVDSGVGAGREDRFARFPYRVGLSWSDGETLTEATIYYSSEKPENCASVLAIHISAAQWLDNNRPEVGAVATGASASTTNALDRTNAPPAPVAPPPRLFPSP
ncbi:MAG TPA: hypothetical protein VMV72_13060 [Verrucomicrobiae bacterium]|nr:hypothetical protein [Verrucomicrobiae bacterium]